MNLKGILKFILGKVGDEAVYDIFKNVIFGGSEKAPAGGHQEVTEGEKSPKIRHGGRLESGDETGYEAAIADIDVAKRTNVNSFVANNLDHHQQQRMRVLVTLLRELRDVYIEKDPVASGTDKKGNPIYRDKERRKVYDPAINFLIGFAEMTDEQKRHECAVNGVLYGDDKWIREQQEKALEFGRKSQEKALEAAQLIESLARQFFFRVLTLGIWDGTTNLGFGSWLRRMFGKIQIRRRSA